MANDEKTVLVCVTIDRDHVAGCTISNCGKCDAAVWVAPTSQALLAEHDCEILCVACARAQAAREAAAGEKVAIMAPNADQLREIGRELERRARR